MKLYLTLAIILVFTSCTQRGCQRFERKWQYSNRHYSIEMYSGGQVVFKDTFYGIINQEDSSDGAYYFKGDSLIELSGDYIIRSIK